MAVQPSPLLMGHSRLNAGSRVPLGPLLVYDARWIFWLGYWSALHRHRRKQRQVSSILSKDEPSRDQSSRCIGGSGWGSRWRLHVAALLALVPGVRCTGRILRSVLSCREAEMATLIRWIRRRLGLHARPRQLLYSGVED